jgi:hypothetical protein
MSPEPGSVYYVLRPPWARISPTQAFYTLHPEERQWGTGSAAQELAASRAPGSGPAAVPPSRLTYDSRLGWGVNFMTGTPAAARTGKMFG